MRCRHFICLFFGQQGCFLSTQSWIKLSRWDSSFFRHQRGFIFEIHHCAQTVKNTTFSWFVLYSFFILVFICLTQRCCKEARPYLSLKSGVDTDLPTDHQASSSAYQPYRNRHQAAPLFISYLYTAGWRATQALVQQGKSRMSGKLPSVSGTLVLMLY